MVSALDYYAEALHAVGEAGPARYDIPKLFLCSQNVIAWGVEYLVDKVQQAPFLCREGMAHLNVILNAAILLLWVHSDLLSDDIAL